MGVVEEGLVLDNWDLIMSEIQQIPKMQMKDKL